MVADVAGRGMAGMVPAGGMLAADLVDRWRGWDPVLWLVTAGLAAAWFAALGAMAVRLRPDRVRPGPATLDLPGDEAPAVVNLLTNGWDLGREAIAATLIDLAGRGHLAIDTLGGRTTVRVAKPPVARTTLPAYDAMVFDHVATLAGRTNTGFVPAEALTTGPDATSGRWWRRFESAVVQDARARGLSRARWPTSVKAAFGLAALPVAAALGMAVSTVHLEEVDETIGTTIEGMLPETTQPPDVTVLEGDIPPGTIGAGGTSPGATSSPASGKGATTPPDTITSTTGASGTPTDGGDIVWFAVMASVAGAMSLGTVLGRLRGERDTPAGREEAARWLGVQEMLGDNPVFAEQPAAGVAIWDRHLGHGAALGVAHGAVRDLPLGAESDTTAWSHVGRRWRVVRIRYPRRLLPGWGAAPWLVTLRAAMLLAAGGATLHYLPRGVDALRDTAGADPATVTALEWAEAARPWLRAAALVALAAGAWLALLGVGDLVRAPRVVSGTLLRHRMRGKVRTDGNRTRDTRVWFLAVDDGTTDRIRAWRMRRDPHVHQGDDVQVTATPVLGYVRDVSVRRTPPAGDRATSAAPPPATTGSPAGPPDQLAGPRLGGEGPPAGPSDGADHPVER